MQEEVLNADPRLSFHENGNVYAVALESGKALLAESTEVIQDIAEQEVKELVEEYLGLNECLICVLLLHEINPRARVVRPEKEIFQWQEYFEAVFIHS
ncbi:hypothetical protein [Bacillus infantis]|uniref:hypothetical protein n=1 Tax=Bacillus infantis TaxID=324767 RepID=UPI003CF87341